MKSSRRSFLEISGLALTTCALPRRIRAQIQKQTLSIIADLDDPIISAPPCRWALGELSEAIEGKAIAVGRFQSLRQAPPDSFSILASGSERPAAAALLKASGVTLPNQPDWLALVPFFRDNRQGLLATGDVRGLMYALLELADRVQNREALQPREAVIERPLNSLRSVGRIFASDIEDKPWYYDRDMWPRYFSMLAAERFNRFSLNLGVGYDFLDNVRDAYFLFAYPFFLPVPGYHVRAVNLPDRERDRNLEMLQYISQQAAAHGIDFHLGIWTHGYQWGPASQPNYTIEGVTPDNHAAYSRDALTALLKACPDIRGVTLRTHGESGVREGSYSFWSTVFSALPRSGRPVELDLHPKGLDQKLIDIALESGAPVMLSPKYWAEHMGLPYHQAAIRELEMPRQSDKPQDFFSLSAGSRSFARYGYADFLREDRRYKILFRVWPGSHRLLLWGDPTSSAAHARAFTFCGSNGVELFEPLSFKGRRGSGIAGSRCAYADRSLETRWDWQKYLYTYRSWGRSIYNPDTSSESCQRYLEKQFGVAAGALGASIAYATPITQIVTTAHLPSAANENYSPEYYTNQSIVDGVKPSPYSDTPAPKVFGNVSPLDPQLFLNSNQFVRELVEKKPSGKYSPLEVAQWLDRAADAALSRLSDAEAHVHDPNSPEFRRTAIDLRIQIGIGHFFAAKFRSGVLYAAYERSGDRRELEEALRQYRAARDLWQSFAVSAKGAYLSDITFGTSPHQRGNWLDRLPAIDEDIAAVEKKLESAPAIGQWRSSISLGELTVPAKREWLEIDHTPASRFVPGRQLEIAIEVEPGTESLAARLHYRHVNQAERYQSTDFEAAGHRFSAVIPATYTNSSYPLQYYFELCRGTGNAWLFPGLGKDLNTQPYFVIRPA